MTMYITTQHPLATIEIDSKKCHPFSEWWTAQWKDPLTPIEVRESLIHVIYDAFDDHDYIATLLLLDIADGYLHQTGWRLPEDTHHTFSESESEARRTLACKAAKVLFTSNYLRNNHDNHQWLLGWPTLFNKILWFFNDRSRRPMNSSNLPSKEDSRKWIREVHDFVLEFCRSFWSIRLCNHDNEKDCKQVCSNNRDYVEQIRPDLFEMILRSGGALHQNHHLLRDKKLLQSDACMTRFKELASCRVIRVVGNEFPYTPYASPTEALLMEGSEWAALYLAAEIFRLELTATAV